MTGHDKEGSENNIVKISLDLTPIMIKLIRNYASLKTKLGRDPTDQEILDKMDMTVEELREISLDLMPITSKLLKTSASLKTELGREPTNQEISEKMDMPVVHVKYLLIVAKAPAPGYEPMPGYENIRLLYRDLVKRNKPEKQT
jgi:DNA-directed RNA polymerase sigma subunit (sigma70/sigma32)